MDLEGRANPLASHHVAGTLWWGGPCPCGSQSIICVVELGGPPPHPHPLTIVNGPDKVLHAIFTSLLPIYK